MSTEKKSVDKIVNELEQKYFDLVWYIRNRKHSKNPASKKLLLEIEEKYPEEIEEFSEDDEGWIHGFNSGCLAMSRLLRDIYNAKSDDDIESSMEEFPFLDT